MCGPFLESGSARAHQNLEVHLPPVCFVSIFSSALTPIRLLHLCGAMGSSQSKKKWDCTRYLNGNAPVASQGMAPPPLASPYPTPPSPCSHTGLVLCMQRTGRATHHGPCVPPAARRRRGLQSVAAMGRSHPSPRRRPTCRTNWVGLVTRDGRNKGNIYVSVSVSLGVCLPMCLYVSVCLACLCVYIYMSICLSISIFVCLSMSLYLYVCLPVSGSISICLVVCLCMCLYVPVWLSTSLCLCIYLSLCLPVWVSISLCLVVCLSISIRLLVCLSPYLFLYNQCRRSYL